MTEVERKFCNKSEDTKIDLVGGLWILAIRFPLKAPPRKLFESFFPFAFLCNATQLELPTFKRYVTQKPNLIIFSITVISKRASREVHWFSVDNSISAKLDGKQKLNQCASTEAGKPNILRVWLLGILQTFSEFDYLEFLITNKTNQKTPEKKFRKLFNEAKWYRNFKGKFPENMNCWIPEKKNTQPKIPAIP